MKKSMILILVVGMMSVLLMGCLESTDVKQRRQTESALKEADSQIGMPAIKNFQERKLAKMIFELRDQEKLVTYAYIVSWQGELIFLGKCIGFGLPYSVQYTNPEKYYNGVTLPQADPNGLFMPEGLSATWLMMIDKETGKARPVYCEPQIIVSPFPLHNVVSTK